MKWPKQPWQKLQIDIVDEIYGAPSTHKCIIVVHDLHSKWPEIHPCSYVSSQRVISFLCDLSQGGVYQRLQFQTVVLKFDQMNLHLFWPTKGSSIPQQHYITHNLMEELSDLTKHRSRVTFHHVLQETFLNYQTSRHCTTGFAASQLMIRWQFQLPLSILQPSFQILK